MTLEKRFNRKKHLFIIGFLCLPMWAMAQSWPEISRVTTSQEFQEMHADVQQCILFLQQITPQGDPVGRMDAERFLNTWTAGVPYISIYQLDYLYECTEENQTLITQHLAGKLSAYFQVNAMPNTFESEWEGLNWMLDLYQEGGFETIAKMDELIQKRKQDTLKAWLREQIPASWNLN